MRGQEGCGDRRDAGTGITVPRVLEGGLRSRSWWGLQGLRGLTTLHPQRWTVTAGPRCCFQQGFPSLRVGTLLSDPSPAAPSPPSPARDKSGCKIIPQPRSLLHTWAWLFMFPLHEPSRMQPLCSSSNPSTSRAPVFLSLVAILLGGGKRVRHSSFGNGVDSRLVI